MTNLATIIRRFDQPDEVREFDKGRLEVVTIAGQTLGRATYQPGWKWSVHVGPLTGGDEPYVSLHLLGAATYAK